MKAKEIINNMKSWEIVDRDNGVCDVLGVNIEDLEIIRNILDKSIKSENTESMNTKVINYFKCDHCNNQWLNQWDYEREELCPQCETVTMPWKTENINYANGDLA